MKHGQLDDHTHAVRLELGEDVHEQIQRFCRDQRIDNAAVSGIGSVDSPTLAHYSVKAKQFTDKQLAGIYEVTSLLGNVALVDDQPFAHLHVTLSGPNMEALGGHLVKGACSATLELVITTYPSHHRKTPDSLSGLSVWDFYDI
jgi:predicted DNA-binding protein with PD1-like motif